LDRLLEAQGTAVAGVYTVDTTGASPAAVTNFLRRLRLDYNLVVVIDVATPNLLAVSG
jgi:hypothetical protein